MVIVLENKTVPSYKEAYHQIKRIQEKTESVVPDINDDIGKISSVQSTCLLKSKDIVSDGISISGEVAVSILYITEAENTVESIKLNKSFTMLFEMAETPLDSAAHINLQVSNIEARIVNPRKVSVTLEICGELRCFVSEMIENEGIVPEDNKADLKTNLGSFEVMLPNAVCEKSFAINEQYVFPSGKAEPSQLVFQKVNLHVSDTQHIGSKVIVKGSVNLSVCYLSKNVNYPVFTQFNSAFSQIIDTGVESMDSSSVQIELTSCYFNLIETISGEHALDTELHAVLQIVSRKRETINFISDVYSNLMPVDNVYQKQTVYNAAPMQHEKISIDEKLSVAEDCEDVLCVIPTTEQVSLTNTNLNASIIFDIIYKTKSGNISSVRRTINTEANNISPKASLINHRLTNINIHPNDTIVEVNCFLEYAYQSFENIEYSKVHSVEMMEDDIYDQGEFPSISIVRLDEETLWDLAKKYHSSIEKILSKNNTEFQKGSFIMIPKE